jgi:hypothetical protein
MGLLAGNARDCWSSNLAHLTNRGSILFVSSFGRDIIEVVPRFIVENNHSDTTNESGAAMC